jgi:hypothetical protein
LHDVLGVVDPALFGTECVTDSVVTECLPAGSYIFIMLPTFDDPVACGKEYEVNLECTPCVIPLGACCRPDGSCDDGIAEAACENWQGDGTLCANVSCPQPPPNDLCDNAITVAIPSVTAGDTSLATFDTGLPATCGTSISSAGVWYQVIGNGNTITLDTCNGATTYDSKISVFCPNCQTPACVTGNDDACGPTGFQSSVSWCSAPGETYLIWYTALEARQAHSSWSCLTAPPVQLRRPAWLFRCAAAAAIAAWPDPYQGATMRPAAKQFVLSIRSVATLHGISSVPTKPLPRARAALLSRRRADAVVERFAPSKPNPPVPLETGIILAIIPRAAVRTFLGIPTRTTRPCPFRMAPHQE